MTAEPYPWQELADLKIERDADCVTRDLISLIDRQAFREVRIILREAQDYMDETIDSLEEDVERKRA